MTDEEYNKWFTLGYDSHFTGDECPPDATRDQKSAWRDGLSTGSEEND